MQLQRDKDKAPGLTKGILATQRQGARSRLSPKVILSSPKPARAQSRWASLPPFMHVSDLWRSLGCSCGRRSLRCSCQTCSFTRWTCTWPLFASYSFSICKASRHPRLHQLSWCPPGTISGLAHREGHKGKWRPEPSRSPLLTAAEPGGVFSMPSF